MKRSVAYHDRQESPVLWWGTYVMLTIAAAFVVLFGPSLIVYGLAGWTIGTIITSLTERIVREMK